MPLGSFTLSASGAATVLHAASHFIPLLVLMSVVISPTGGSKCGNSGTVCTFTRQDAQSAMFSPLVHVSTTSQECTSALIQASNVSAFLTWQRRRPADHSLKLRGWVVNQPIEATSKTCFCCHGGCRLPTGLQMSLELVEMWRQATHELKSHRVTLESNDLFMDIKVVTGRHWCEA